MAPTGLRHGNGDVAARRMMHHAFVFVGPRGVAEDALDREIGFHRGLFLADGRSQPMRDLVAPLDHVFRDVVDHLRARVRRRPRPAGRVARRFHRVANVFAIAERRFAEQLAVAPVNRERVAGIGPRLFAADVLLHRAVNWRSPPARCRPPHQERLSILRGSFLARSRQRVQPLRRQILQHPLAPAFAPVARFAIAAESAGRVELVGRSSPTPPQPSPARPGRAPH